jgi:ribonuclease D
VLKCLARWREGLADEKNRARGFVISDSAMLQLARVKPSTQEQLKTITDIHPVALSRYQETLLQLIDEAHRNSAPVENLEQLDERQRQKLNKMRDIVENRATELGVEAALLASRRELEKLIRAVAADEPLPERFLGWRKEVVTDQLIAVA